MKLADNFTEAIRQIGAERVLASRREQGLPESVEDPNALRQIGELVGGRHGP